MTGTYLRAGHDVEPSQQEPDLPTDQQVARHDLKIGLLQWDFNARIGMHERFAAEIFLPVRVNFIDAEFEDTNGQRLPDYESIHHRDETIAGVGDLVLGGRIGLVRPQDVPRWNLDLRLGVSQPTGRIEPDPFVLGEAGHEHQHMFFGTGTFDPQVGVETQVTFDKWRLVGWTASRYPLYENRYGYRASRFIAAGVGANTGFGLKRTSFLLQPEIFYETPARWSGVAARNSGRVSLLAAGGVFFAPVDRLYLHAIVKVPYFTKSQGGQLRWPVVGVVGFTVSFDAS
jgi:hypothetical protein